MENYQKIIKDLDESGIYDKVRDRLSNSTIIAISALKEKDLDPRNDDFLFALINTVSVEAVRQAVAISVKILEQQLNQDS
ncbi:hypothetical protein [Paenibacillus wynnii]|uniref:Uncharacterized protein n=1 Tax=Paenibacillus wynnii TaxID=268407 RepID=A0A098MF42_9BACL|nr:hypothetical protein [Paenibacillus wynnii]KGE20676.1 hypothetical protein PWYN_00290 [Paenibacillus wynnii]